MTPIIRHPIDHPSAWVPGDFSSKDDFSVDLQPRQLDAFAAEIERLPAEDAARFDDIDARGFDLSPITGDIQRWQREIAEGRGIINLRGFPVDDYSVEDLALMYYGLASQLGVVVSQSVMGDRVGHVIEVDKLLHGERRRAYKGAHEMALHTDFCDILGMLCIQMSEAGGESRYASGAAIHNEILATRPDLLEPLYNGFHFYRIGENRDEPVTPYRVPLFSSCGGTLSMHCAGDWKLFIDPENTGVAVTDREYEAIEYFTSIAEREDIRFDFMIEPGECFFSNNWSHIHARSAIENSADPNRRRHMLRVWIDCPVSFRDVVPEVRIYPHYTGIPATPELVHVPGVEM